ncbi:MAG: hypothetical protein ACR2GD_07470 [Pyrinomonadaceae bacterium]
MNENKIERYEIDVSGWFAVCDAAGIPQAVFPAENLAEWYLEKYGWSNWKIRQISGEGGSPEKTIFS